MSPDPGLEHGIVSLRDGTRWIVRGGANGIDVGNIDAFRRLLVHTHGELTGPSGADFNFLINNGYMRGYIVEVGAPGEIIRFNQNRSWWTIPVR